MSALPARRRGQDRHHFSHVLNTSGFCFCDGRIYGLRDLRVAHLLRQVTAEKLQLEFLYVGKILARSLLVLRDRLAPLLDHLLDHRDDVGVGEFFALVDFALLDRRKNQAHGDRRSASFARIAAFMSSVIWFLSSVHLLRQHLAAQALVMALHGGGKLALAFCGRLS